MQHGADQCSAYLVVWLHPNIGVPRTAVHRRSLLPDKVCHLNTPSRVSEKTDKHMLTLVLPAQAQCTPSLKSHSMKGILAQIHVIHLHHINQSNRLNLGKQTSCNFIKLASILHAVYWFGKLTEVATTDESFHVDFLQAYI